MGLCGSSPDAILRYADTWELARGGADTWELTRGSSYHADDVDTIYEFMAFSGNFFLSAWLSVNVEDNNISAYDSIDICIYFE